MSISEDTYNKLGAGASVYQLHSDQTGLFPKSSGKLTSEHIWDAQVMVDHFSDLTYVHLMISTTQEENKAGKIAFGTWDYTFGVKLNIYHAGNGQFLNSLPDQQARMPTIL